MNSELQNVDFDRKKKENQDAVMLKTCFYLLTRKNVGSKKVKDDIFVKKNSYKVTTNR